MWQNLWQKPELADHNDSVREVAAVIEIVAAGDVQECVVCHILSLTNKIKNYFFFCLFPKVFKVMDLTSVEVGDSKWCARKILEYCRAPKMQVFWELQGFQKYSFERDNFVPKNAPFGANHG